MTAWRKATLTEIPPAGPRSDLEFWAPWREDPEFGAKWHSVREFFGIHGFGCSANEGAAGDELVVAHTEEPFGGQEELYLVVRGRARFVCDGEEVDVGEGELLYAPPSVDRRARALETPTIVFCVGGVPGKPYRHWLEDAPS
jgi:mannose-6-phosphate isomerase-like protein (cupin superfamily)